MIYIPELKNAVNEDAHGLKQLRGDIEVTCHDATDVAHKTAWLIHRAFKNEVTVDSLVFSVDGDVYVCDIVPTSVEIFAENNCVVYRFAVGSSGRPVRVANDYTSDTVATTQRPGMDKELGLAAKVLLCAAGKFGNIEMHDKINYGWIFDGWSMNDRGRFLAEYDKWLESHMLSVGPIQYRHIALYLADRIESYDIPI